MEWNLSILPNLFFLGAYRSAVKNFEIIKENWVVIFHLPFILGAYRSPVKNIRTKNSKI